MVIRSKLVAIPMFVFAFAGIAEGRGLLEKFKLPEQASARVSSHEKNQKEVLSLYSMEQRRSSFESCEDQFPASRPLPLTLVPSTLKPIALCSDNFAVLYSLTSKTPLVVVERLSAAQLRDAKGEERTNQFYPDLRIPKEGRAELSDYRAQKPAVDRGHQAPAGDAPNSRAMKQSFVLSNIVPQDPTNNRKVWRKVETDVRKFAQRASGSVFVFTGPIFDDGHETVGKGKVWKPTRLFKLVYDESSNRAWAYILLNGNTRIERPMDYQTFLKATGMHLLDGISVTGTIAR